MNILKGNAQDADTRGTGWFVGFGDWTLLPGSDLLHVPKDQPLAGLCLKWYDHPESQESGPKPVSAGRTISILVSDGCFEIDFSTDPDFHPDAGVERVVLRRQGDFVAWGEGIYHRWRCAERTKVLTVRWGEAAAGREESGRADGSGEVAPSAAGRRS